MKWPYNRYEVDVSRICPSGVVFRPEAKLLIQGERGDEVIRALVDTGADHTIVPMSVADLIGAKLFYDEVDVAKGVGDEIAIIPGRVRLELVSDNESCAWSAIIGFADFTSSEAECSLLGHAGCFEYFLASFDGVERYVELMPRTDLPNLE